ncbi:HNH endonuclease [Limosilactobacillus reuteri]|uniref:HNH endonuclease signature motif containing protein n=1 Tax=Limosilactobacillus reuteri TaxID=1598 RepID=UPI001E30E0F2|nr:HNH endonuclease signature motif containing protein [Limosilactobacillus reuteri]MCC4349797.1 HNH endonuclease [Limosilactobacillus reuteri]MCC4360915.1 HNH endonuclease [Limosilactobacillus reuteri]MCC4379246.1 HNH endonuclease [Limosilactobacillus reuteri]MCC4406584.1 HNH endonuclease [Limosilactobacillus reuteri]MCC4416095.1 HNH endonuclease [Limosilactobacillus reuteri]
MVKPIHLCNHAGCGKLIPFDETYCHKHEYKKPIEYADQKERHQVNKAIYRKRMNSKHESKYLRFYKSKEWRKLSHHWLMINPLCEACKSHGIVRKGDVVDHIVELRDNFEKRLDEDNLQTLCYSCHNKKTKREKTKREKRKLQNLF